MADQSKDRENSRHQDHEAHSEVRDSGGQQHAAPVNGGTTDLDQNSLRSSTGNQTQRGSGATTKDTVTGSDYDGQVSGG